MVFARRIAHVAQQNTIWYQESTSQHASNFLEARKSLCRKQQLDLIKNHLTQWCHTLCKWMIVKIVKIDSFSNKNARASALRITSSRAVRVPAMIECWLCSILFASSAYDILRHRYPYYIRQAFAKPKSIHTINNWEKITDYKSNIMATQATMLLTALFVVGAVLPGSNANADDDTFVAPHVRAAHRFATAQPGDSAPPPPPEGCTLARPLILNAFTLVLLGLDLPVPRWIWFSLSLIPTWVWGSRWFRIYC